MESSNLRVLNWFWTLKIDVPILNLYGLKDRLVPPDASTALSGMVVKRSSTTRCDFDCGHIGMYTLGGQELKLQAKPLDSGFARSF